MGYPCRTLPGGQKNLWHGIARETAFPKKLMWVLSLWEADWLLHMRPWPTMQSLILQWQWRWRRHWQLEQHFRVESIHSHSGHSEKAIITIVLLHTLLTNTTMAILVWLSRDSSKAGEKLQQELHDELLAEKFTLWIAVAAVCVTGVMTLIYTQTLEGDEEWELNSTTAEMSENVINVCHFLFHSHSQSERLMVLWVIHDELVSRQYLHYVIQSWDHLHPQVWPLRNRTLAWVWDGLGCSLHDCSSWSFCIAWGSCECICSTYGWEFAQKLDSNKFEGYELSRWVSFSVLWNFLHIANLMFSDLQFKISPIL
jgi:hypothetical protein